MKKGLIIFLFALLLIPTAVFASESEGGFGLSVGAAVTYDKNIGGIVDNPDTLRSLKVQDFSFGLDVNMKIFIVDIDFVGYYRKGLNDKFGAGGLMSVNVGPDLGPFRISLGLGYDWGFNIQREDKFTFGSDESDLGKNFTHSPLHLRGALDINISSINVKIYGVLPTNLTLAEFKVAEMFKDFDFKNIKIGVVVGFKLI